MQAVNREPWGRTAPNPVNPHWLKGKNSSRAGQQTRLAVSYKSRFLTDRLPQYLTQPEYDDDYRHWSPTSQPFTSAEVLLQHLRDGWQLQDRVTVRTFPCFSRRCVRLYTFLVLLDNRHSTIPVLENPVVLRLIYQHGLKLVNFTVDCDTNSLP